VLLVWLACAYLTGGPVIQLREAAAEARREAAELLLDAASSRQQGHRPAPDWEPPEMQIGPPCVLVWKTSLPVTLEFVATEHRQQRVVTEESTPDDPVPAPLEPPPRAAI